MSDAGKRLVTRLVEAFNRGNLTAADELFSLDYVRHIGSSPDLRGPEQWKAMATSFRSAFPDMVTTVEAMVGEGDLVATRWIARGTHRASMMGEVPSNREVIIQGVLLSRLAKGRIAEEWEYYDERAMFAGMGMAPPPVERP
ncbi:MAG TPA: ester cyclase [Gammaproteobacteria bacterium]|nr:ester cyclase [Gammaproteobacteria bacterium]